MENLIGKGRAAIGMVVDPDSFVEGVVGDLSITDKEFGPGAVIGTAKLNNETCTIIAIDAMKVNRKFRVVYAGIIGLEEGYKMALAVYHSIKADESKPPADKRPLVLIVDTPGNGPGKLEEMFGMNKATGALADEMATMGCRTLGECLYRRGQEFVRAFLCHGLQADHILSLAPKFGTLVHVMPLTSIARITKLDIEWLQELAESNPVFAAGPDFFYRLGGIEELIDSIETMGERVSANVADVRAKKAAGREEELGPWGRGTLGAERGGRRIRGKVMETMNTEFAAVARRYLG